MIPELAQLVKSSIEECLEDRISISFSGGVDSSLIAHIAKENCEVDLFSAGTESSQDLQYAKEVAKQLGLNYYEKLLDGDFILELYKELYGIIPGSLIHIGILLPIYACAKEAKSQGHDTMLVGSGSEELFVGYNRYYTYLRQGKDLDSILKEEFRTLPKRDVGMVSKILRAVGLEPRFPFMNGKLAKFLFSIPLEKRMEEEELKKGLLREAAKILNLPELPRTRKKKAAQYGSGVHKILLKNSKFLNKEYPPKFTY